VIGWGTDKRSPPGKFKPAPTSEYSSRYATYVLYST